jgi:hypothetical protein
MKITGRQLRQIIKEELERTMSEADNADSSILDQVRMAAKILKSNMDTGMYNPDPGVGTSADAKEAWMSSLRYGFKAYPGSIGGRSHIIIACVAPRPIPVFGQGPFRGNGVTLKNALIKIARDNGLSSLNPEEGHVADRSSVQIYTDDGIMRDSTIEEMPYQNVWAVAV